MVRKHASLDKDAELERAAWVATRGAVVGAAKVSPCPVLRSNQCTSTLPIDRTMLTTSPVSSGDWSQQQQRPLHTSSAQCIEA